MLKVFLMSKLLLKEQFAFVITHFHENMNNFVEINGRKVLQAQMCTIQFMDKVDECLTNASYFNEELRKKVIEYLKKPLWSSGLNSDVDKAINLKHNKKMVISANMCHSSWLKFIQLL